MTATALTTRPIAKAGEKTVKIRALDIQDLYSKEDLQKEFKGIHKQADRVENILNVLRDAAELQDDQFGRGVVKTVDTALDFLSKLHVKLGGSEGMALYLLRDGPAKWVE